MSDNKVPNPFNLLPEEKVAVFVDGQHVYAATRQVGFDLDYSGLLDNVQTHAQLVRGYYYTVMPDETDGRENPVRPIIDFLDYHGYTVTTKPIKEFTDQDGRQRERGSIAVEMTVDMLQIAKRVDHIILFSGDGNYRSAVEAVKNKGARVTIVSVVADRGSDGVTMISDDLRRQADAFVNLLDLGGITGLTRKPRNGRV